MEVVDVDTEGGEVGVFEEGSGADAVVVGERGVAEFGVFGWVGGAVGADSCVGDDDGLAFVVVHFSEADACEHADEA